MIEKINNDIENLNKEINENDANINKYFELLDNINSQASEVQQNIEKLQLKNQASNKEIKRLELSGFIRTSPLFLTTNASFLLFNDPLPTTNILSFSVSSPLAYFVRLVMTLSVIVL